MLCAVAGNAAWQDLSTLRDETAKLGNILVINMIYLIDTESADLFARLSASVTSDQSNSLLNQNGISSSGMDGPNEPAPPAGCCGMEAPAPWVNPLCWKELSPAAEPLESKNSTSSAMISVT